MEWNGTTGNKKTHKHKVCVRSSQQISKGIYKKILLDLAWKPQVYVSCGLDAQSVGRQKLLPYCQAPIIGGRRNLYCALPV